MRKLTALLLILSMAFSFAACGKNSSGAAQLEIGTVTRVSDVAEFEIVNLYEAENVLPPNTGSVYSYHSAEPGNTYLVLVVKLKNLRSGEAYIDDLLKVTLSAGGGSYSANPAAETENGTNLSSYHSLKPLETARVHFLAEVPAGGNYDQVKAEISTQKKRYSATLSMEAFANAIPVLTKGQVLSDDQTIELTLEDVFTTDALYPPKAEGYYRYFTADTDQVYLVMQCRIKNLRGNGVDYDELAGVSCVYDGKYRYSSITVFQEDDGANLSSYASSNQLKPLESNTVYYLMEIPKEAENGPLTIKLYLSGTDYRYNFG